MLNAQAWSTLWRMANSVKKSVSPDCWGSKWQGAGFAQARTGLSGRREEVFELANAVFPVRVGLTFDADALASDICLVPGYRAHDT
jgi:hypothetical protein